MATKDWEKLYNDIVSSFGVSIEVSKGLRLVLESQDKIIIKQRLFIKNIKTMMDNLYEFNPQSFGNLKPIIEKIDLFISETY